MNECGEEYRKQKEGKTYNIFLLGYIRRDVGRILQDNLFDSNDEVLRRRALGAAAVGFALIDNGHSADWIGLDWREREREREKVEAEG